MSYADTTQFAALGLPALALSGFTGDVQDHLDAASGVIDSYLRGRYVLPISTPIPQELVNACCAIAAYTLLSIRGFDPELGSNANVRLRYEDAMALLRALSKGEINLGLTADATPTAHDGGPIVLSKARNTSRAFRGLDDGIYTDRELC